MAHNTIPTLIGELLDLGGEVGKGVTKLGAGLDLLQYTATNFPPLVTALQGKQNVFNAKRGAVVDASRPQHAALNAIRKACLDARKLLSISLGDDWSTAWVPAGWTAQTTEVPKDEAGLLALANSLQSFLTAHPDFEVDTPKITFTATRFTALIVAFETADTQLTAARSAQDDAGGERTGAARNLKGALREIVTFLGNKLGANDPRWDEFGLNRPGAQNTPAQAVILSLAKAGANTVVATAQPAPGVTYWRWKTRLVGVDTQPRFWGRTKDPLVRFTGQPGVGTLEVTCEAANEAGAGKASKVASIALD